jgi:hypothetical protein
MPFLSPLVAEISPAPAGLPPDPDRTSRGGIMVQVRRRVEQSAARCANSSGFQHLAGPERNGELSRGGPAVPGCYASTA